MRVHRSRTGAAMICDDAQRTAPIIELVKRADRGRSDDGVHSPVLAVGVVGVGAVYAFAVGASVFESSARGRKYDFKDAERLVRRLIANELILSLVPNGEQRTWRNMTRIKLQLTRDISRLICRALETPRVYE